MAQFRPKKLQSVKLYNVVSVLQRNYKTILQSIFINNDDVVSYSFLIKKIIVTFNSNICFSLKKKFFLIYMNINIGNDINFNTSMFLIKHINLNLILDWKIKYINSILRAI